MCDGFGDSHHKMNKNRHLGMHQDEYLPLNRGFDNFYGVRMKRSVTTLCATLHFVALILRAAHNAYPLRRLSTQILTGGGSHTKHISVSQQVIARGETGKSVYTGANLWDNGAFSMDNQLPTHTTELYTKKELKGLGVTSMDELEPKQRENLQKVLDKNNTKSENEELVSSSEPSFFLKTNSDSI